MKNSKRVDNNDNNNNDNYESEKARKLELRIKLGATNEKIQGKTGRLKKYREKTKTL